MELRPTKRAFVVYGSIIGFLIVVLLTTPHIAAWVVGLAAILAVVLAIVFYWLSTLKLSIVGNQFEIHSIRGNRSFPLNDIKRASLEFGYSSTFSERINPLHAVYRLEIRISSMNEEKIYSWPARFFKGAEVQEFLARLNGSRGRAN